MTLYNYNPKSFLNKPIVRIINTIILVPILLALSSATFHCIEYDLKPEVVIIALAYIVASTCVGVKTILKKNRWVEFDKAEAYRKESFIVFYCCVSVFFTSIISLFGVRAFISYDCGGQFYWYILLIMYFLFNRINICSLLNFGDFIDGQFPFYDCDEQKLSIQEVKKVELDIIKYVLKRDYEIDIDELMWDLRRFRGLEK